MNLKYQSSEPITRGMDAMIIDTTSVGWIDGLAGRLFYRGIDVVELISHSHFEETAFLLMVGSLPTQTHLKAFCWKMHQMAYVNDKTLRILQELPTESNPLLMYQTALAALAAMESGVLNDAVQNIFDASMRITAQTPVILAASYRHVLGKPFVSPRTDLSHVENFLYMLTGSIPSKHKARCLELTMIVLMENGFTSSTFVSRATASTMANLYASLCAGVGALSGSLVGGTCLEVYEMVQSAKKAPSFEDWHQKRVEEKKPFVGLGHRVYETQDPRALIVEDLLKQLLPKSKPSVQKTYTILQKIKDIALQENEKNFPTVDYWATALYEALEIESFMFPAMTAFARVVGWCAHILELRQDNCLYRPRSLYTGTIDQPYIPLSQRSPHDIHF